MMSGISQAIHVPRGNAYAYGQRVEQNYTFQQTFAQAIDAQIEFITDEGDIVSLSNSLALASITQDGAWITPVGYGQEFTMASLQNENLELSVQGDLSEEELADIKRLLKELTDIASTFFNGGTEAAISEAASLGELGSLSSLSASFLQTTQTTMTYASYHPVPTMDTDTLKDFQKLYSDSFAEETSKINYEEILQARWQQILSMLDKPEEAESNQAPAPEEQNDTLTPVAVATAQDAAAQMVGKIDETMAKHPRLSPFAGPLALEALDKTMSSSEEVRRDAKALGLAMKHLRHNLFKELKNWLKPNGYGQGKHRGGPEQVSI